MERAANAKWEMPAHAAAQGCVKLVPPALGLPASETRRPEIRNPK
jgi:hypothetical protein